MVDPSRPSAEHAARLQALGELARAGAELPWRRWLGEHPAAVAS